MAEVNPGARLRCADCGSEVVVVKSAGSVPRCCDKEMESQSAARR